MARFFDDVGSGPAILFSHGTLMDRTMFDAQVKDLGRDDRCVAFDSRARTGRSRAFMRGIYGR